VWSGVEEKSIEALKHLGINFLDWFYTQEGVLENPRGSLEFFPGQLGIAKEGSICRFLAIKKI
jgi:hypothetical protein